MIALEEDLNLLAEQWEAELAGAVSEDELQKREQAITKRIEELIEQAREVADSSDTIDALYESEVEKEQRAAYMEKRAEVQEKIGELYNCASDEGAIKEKDLKRIDSTAADDYPAATEELQELLEHTVQRIDFVKKMREQFLQNINEEYQKAKIEVSNARKLLSRKTKGFEPYFDNVDQELDDLKESFSETTNISVIESASRAFAEVVRTMNKALEDAKSKKGPTFTGVLEHLADVLKKLNGGTIKECKPAAQKALLEEYKSVQGSLKTQSPTEAAATVSEFETKVNEVDQAATNAKFYRENIIKPNIKTVRGKIESLEKLVKGLEYTAALKTKLQGIEGTAAMENKEGEANRKLADLLLEVNRAIDQPEFRDEKDQAARDAKQKQTELEQQWKSKREIFDSLLKDVRKAMDDHEEADETLWDELKAMKKAAADLAKNLAFDQAVKKIESATTYAIKVKNNPQGEKVTSRGNLPKDLGRYHKGVKAFNTSIKAIVDTVNDSADILDESALKTTVNMLNKMAFEFDKSLFDRPVGLLSSKDAKVDAKRKSREEALRGIRLYQEKLDKGPLMIKVLLAPFDVAQRPAFDEVRLALNSLDVNIRRCV